MKNKLIGFTLVCLIPLSLFAQNKDENITREPVANFENVDIIALPELTTTVSGDSITAGKDSLADFSTVITFEDDGAAVLPKLPEKVEDGTSSAEEESETAVASKNIFVQGVLGGGFPNFFGGDFSVYNYTGENPFLIHFKSDSYQGFGLKSAVNGYSNSTTIVEGKKQINVNNLVFNISGSYNDFGYGFQKVSPKYYDLNSQVLETVDDLTWKLPKGFNLSAGIDFQRYGRYETVFNSAGATTLPLEDSISVYFINPTFDIGWKGLDDNLYFDFDANYVFEKIHGYSNYSVLTKLHRMEFEVNGGYKYKNDSSKISFDVFANGGIVCGTAIGENTVVPEFDLDFTLNLPSKTNRNYVFELAGGIDSLLEKVSDFETENPYCVMLALPSETTDAYVDFKTTIPLYNTINVKGEVEFRKTLFGNNSYRLANQLDSKLYSVSDFDKTQIMTDFGFDTLIKDWSVGIQWKSFYMYVPTNEYAQKISVTAAYEQKESKWGFDSEIAMLLVDPLDLIPQINCSAFYRLKDSVKLSVECHDFIKLVTFTQRNLPNTCYSENSAAVTFLIKFIF